ncbi:MAG: ABC transporter permease [Candidatus Neomarinimicrobiota bacterium]
MFTNYLKIAFRNIIKHKGYSLLNILGLAIGMACAFLITLWVRDEISYNRFNENIDQLHMVYKEHQMANGTSQNPRTPYLLAQTIRDEIPEIINSVAYFTNSATVRYGDHLYNERGICYTDVELFSLFTFPLVKGDINSIINSQNWILITEEIAAKYFADSDPIGEILTLDNEYQYVIMGVVKNIPENSNFRFNFFAPIKSIESAYWDISNWYSHFTINYIQLPVNADIAAVEAKLTTVISHNIDDESIRLRLQPVSKMHLYSITGEDNNIKYVYMFSIIAVFILLIACINFMNLATARSSKRAREIGLRKVVGAARSQLIRQFLLESMLITLLALVLGLTLAEIILPFFNDLAGKNLALRLADFSMLSGLTVITILTGLISGSYPAFYLSSLRPVQILKGGSHSKSGGSLFRKILVIIQFTLSTVLIIGTFTVYSQLKYINEKDLGFARDNRLYFPLEKPVNEQYDAFRNEILNTVGISNVSRTSALPTSIWSVIRGVTWEGMESEKGQSFALAAVDYDFIETMDINIVQGRNFSRDFPTDETSFIFNEEAIRVLGLDDPLGHQFEIGDDFKGAIIGIVSDFIFLPMTMDLEPLMMVIYPEYWRYIMVKTDNAFLPETITRMEEIWNRFAPDFPFEYHFLDAEFDRIYHMENRMGKLFGSFAFLAIFISCLGLLGLAAFLVEQKTKEIGIRKTLGASTSGIIQLLSTEFVKWVLLANMIAAPIAYYSMSKWLQTFIYHTNIGLTVFIFTALLTITIALVTVFIQVIKAALANPVKSLRYE